MVALMAFAACSASWLDYPSLVLWSDRHSLLIAVGLYGLSALYAIFLLRRGLRQDNRINYILLLGAAVFHTSAMFKRGFSLQQCPINNLYEATTFIGWAILATYL